MIDARPKRSVQIPLLKAAALALEKSRQEYRKDSVILFFLSMAHGRLNEKQQARTFYDQAAQWRMGIGLTEEELRRGVSLP